MEIKNIHLLEKVGGKSGHYVAGRNTDVELITTISIR